MEAEKKAGIDTISHLEGEVQMLNSKLDQMTKSVKMLTNWKKSFRLDKMWETSLV